MLFLEVKQSIVRIKRHTATAATAAFAADEAAPQRERVVVDQPAEKKGVAAGKRLSSLGLEFRRVEPGGEKQA